MAIAKPPKIKPTGAMIGGLPTYSKAQFQQVRPGGSYQSYLNFIKTRRGNAPGPAWPGRGGPGLPTLMSMMQNMKFETPAQIEARANRMTAAQIAAQRGLASDAAKAGMADALRMQKAQKDAGLAAAEMSKSLISGVGGEYNAAARELSNLATSGLAGIQQGTDRNVAATNEALARVGAPAISPAAMAGPAQGQVALFQGAGLPGQNLVTQGQAAEYGLAGQSKALNLRAEQEANAALSQSTNQINQARQQAYAEIARGRPQVAAQILEQLQTAERQNVALGMSLLEARRGALQTGFEQQQTKIATAATAAQQKVANAQWTKQFNAAQAEAAKKNAQVDEGRSLAMGYFVDMNGNPIKKNGKKIPIPKGFGTSSSSAEPTAAIPGLTPNQAQKQIDKANEEADKMVSGYSTDAKGKRIPGTLDEPGDRGLVDYWPAIKRLRQYGLSQAQAQSIMDSRLQRGEGGRPLFNGPETAAIKAKLKKTYGAKQANTYWNFHVGKINRLYNQSGDAYDAGNDDQGIALEDQANAMLSRMLGMIR